jgi:MFS transporter, AAHS family, benzoate transport protein
MHKLDIHKLADEAELNSFRYKLIGWVILILVLDGYDIAITGAALPAIMADLKIDSTQAGFLASASLVGMMFGTIRSSLDDGDRRRAVQSPAATAGFTRDPIVFAILRFLAGFGLGGILPILIALGTEYMPVKVRARLVALTSCGYAVGGVLAAILGKGLIDTYGWQGVFIAAGAPVVLIPFILKYIPESLPLLVKQNRDAELREMVRKIAPDYPLQAQEQFLVPHEDEVGAVSGGWLFDKLHPKWVLFSFYVLSAVSLVVVGYGAAPGLLFLIVCAVGAFTLGTQILTNAYGGMFYPTAIRSTALGFNYGFGRVGAIIAPVLIGWLVGLNLVPQQNFVAIAVVGVTGVIAVALINHNVSASTHHIDTVAEREAEALASAAAKLARA